MHILTRWVEVAEVEDGRPTSVATNFNSVGGLLDRTPTVITPPNVQRSPVASKHVREHTRERILLYPHFDVMRLLFPNPAAVSPLYTIEVIHRAVVARVPLCSAHPVFHPTPRHFAAQPI